MCKHFNPPRFQKLNKSRRRQLNLKSGISASATLSVRLKPGLKPGLNWFQRIKRKRLNTLVENGVETRLNMSPSPVLTLLASAGLGAR